MSGKAIRYVEIPAKDRHTLAAFYKEAFGWEPTHDDAMRYTTMKSGEVQVGLMQSTEEFPGALTFFIHTDDVAGDLHKATEKGASVAVDTMEIGDMGKVAYFKDPNENVVGLVDF